MPVQKLTKRTVDAIVPGIRTFIYYDSELKGFGVNVTPNGAKSWCVEYRPGSGGRGVAKRRLVLGSVNTLTPDQARTAARNILAAVALGVLPIMIQGIRRWSGACRSWVKRCVAFQPPDRPLSALVQSRPKCCAAANAVMCQKRKSQPRLGMKEVSN